MEGTKLRDFKLKLFFYENVRVPWYTPEDRVGSSFSVTQTTLEDCSANCGQTFSRKNWETLSNHRALTNTREFR